MIEANYLHIDYTLEEIAKTVPDNPGFCEQYSVNQLINPTNL